MSDSSRLDLPDLLMRLVDSLCDQFEAAWQSVAAPVLEAVLPQVPEPARPELFRRLLRLECEHRRKQGQPLEPAEAWRRFAALGPWAQTALAAELEQPQGELVLEVRSGPHAGCSFRCDRQQIVLVGRGPGVNLELPRDQALSRLHFAIEFNPPQARLVDRGSKNKTYLNGKPVESADLHDGDQVQTGKTVLHVALSALAGTLTAEPPSTLTPPSAQPGSQPAIPGFAVEEELGRGGMGVVYRAIRQSDGRRVALKTVPPGVKLTPMLLARFKREMALLERLSHPHIIRFLESGEANGMLYLAMEYVEGTSLSALVKKEGPLPPERVHALGCQMLDALAHAHQQGVVHRDVKPGNLLLSRQGTAERLHLADFGLARAYQESGLTRLTLSDTSGGTPEFMPLEQVKDFHTAGPAADQYAAAATLYYLLTGQHVYERCGSLMELFNRILSSAPIPLRAAGSGPGLPGRLGQVIRQALARQPEQRFPDVSAMHEELSRAL